MSRTADIYAQVPDVACKGLCHGACGPVVTSSVEADSLRDNGINQPMPVTHPVHGPLTCSHLDDAGRCRIYDHRPLICRLFGAVEGMKCPHGCRPKGGYLPDSKAAVLLDALDTMA